MLVNRRYISVDVTASKIEQRNKPLAAVLDMSNYLAGISDAEMLLEGALGRILDAFGFDAGRVYLMDKDGKQLFLAAHSGMEPAGLRTISIDEGFTGKSARNRAFLAQYVADLEDRKRAERLSSMGLKVIVCVPLILWERVEGVINLASRRLISLDHEKIDLLVTVGNQIAVAHHSAMLQRELEGRLAMLKKKKDTIEFVAYSISHDLKSPATGLYGLTRRLWERNSALLDEKGRECCELILKTADYMLQLVERLNGFVSAKEGALRPEKFDSGEVIGAIRSELEPQLAKRGIQWRQSPNLPVIVADKISFGRVIRNLLDNALKYAGTGLSEITVEYEDREGFHVFSVADDGVGIGAELAERIFEPFHRDPSSKGIAGSGLGMAIVKEIAERHGGKAWVDLGRPKGAKVCLSLSKGLIPDKALNSNQD
jgi:signal transduction histidine kinase